MCCHGSNNISDLDNYRDAIPDTASDASAVVALLKEMPEDIRPQFTVDIPSNNLMVCSPVGNQSKFAEGPKASLCISGFCTAPQACLRYLNSIIPNQAPVEAEVNNAFNSGTMKRNLVNILKSVGFNRLDVNNLNACICNPHTSDSLPPTLFTQMLCMISPNGGSKADLVSNSIEYARNNNTAIYTQACHSISAWINRIQSCVEPEGIVLLMGDEANTLLDNLDVWRAIQNNFPNENNSANIRAYLQQKGYNIYQIPHASGQGFGNDGTYYSWHMWPHESVRNHDQLWRRIAVIGALTEKYGELEIFSPNFLFYKAVILDYNDVRVEIQNDGNQIQNNIANNVRHHQPGGRQIPMQQMRGNQMPVQQGGGNQGNANAGQISFASWLRNVRNLQTNSIATYRDRASRIVQNLGPGLDGIVTDYTNATKDATRKNILDNFMANNNDMIIQLVTDGVDPSNFKTAFKSYLEYRRAGGTQLP